MINRETNYSQMNQNKALRLKSDNLKRNRILAESCKNNAGLILSFGYQKNIFLELKKIVTLEF